MPVTNFLLQPPAGSLQAAYRPIVFKVEATSTSGTPLPPFVVCDIYIADKYYKSMIRTAPDSMGANTSTFVFDISDALQEYLQPDIAPVENSELLRAPHMSAKVYCRFRASAINAEGFTVEEGPKPVQGTRFELPANGGGAQSNSFFVINATLQHEDHQDLSEHLKRYKQGAWHNNAYPLTHRNHYSFCNHCSDHFPLVYAGDCLSADLVLNYRLKGTSSFMQAIANDPSSCDAITYQITVNGKRVDVDPDTALPAGQRVFVRYKKLTDIVWQDVGYFTTQSFYFDVPYAGDYEMQMVHFCTPCLSAAPISGYFTITIDTSLAWRGIHPFCVISSFNQDIYVELEIRSIETEETWYPNNGDPSSHHLLTRGDLYIKFFSDAAHLHPLAINQNNLQLFIKSAYDETTNNHYRIFESVNVYNVNSNGNEFFLENVITQNDYEQYDGSGNISTSTQTYSYSPFPSHQLIGTHTGYKGFATLEQYNTVTNTPTGVTKPNAVSDANYIAPLLDGVACPAGAPVVYVGYGFALEVAKVELRIGPGPYAFVYALAVGYTDVGGYQFALHVPKDQPIALTVKARSLAPPGANNDGWIAVRVTLQNDSVKEFQVPDNLETLLPETFKAIKNISISNT